MNVRSRASTKASILTSFPIGSVLNYQTFSTHWYEISTTVNGKKVTGYIQRNM
ncbi:SH3 domain-containing protein [Pseudogracilibacillus sp. SO30301A]|uniref:SH3 domain-containing protein n=1 Tax=Pseudogracilibacillus sp. SO30301A TaxID=3098291 RepID=UPI003FA75A9F